MYATSQNLPSATRGWLAGRRQLALAGVTTAALSLPAIGPATAMTLGQHEPQAYGNVADNLPAGTIEQFRRFLEGNFEDRESFEAFLGRYFKQRPSTWIESRSEPDQKWKLGIQVQTLSEQMAQSLGMNPAAGVAVTRVVDKSPADEAGISPGDVITSLNGQEISDPEDLSSRIGEASGGDTLELSVWRQGEVERLQVELSGSEIEPSAEQAALPKGRIGVHLVSITEASRKRYQLGRDVEGALIVGVEPGSPAFEMGLRAGDVIGMVGQSKVLDPQDVVSKVKDAARDGRESVLVLIDRDGARQFVPVEIG